jgi:hypothetical protein
MTLFVGESAPASGAFFYYGNTSMSRNMRRAVEAVLGESSDFLETFKAYGWYLDDIVLTPVNDLTRSQRKAACLSAQNSLAERIAECRPLAIVTLLLGIRHIVEAAAIATGNNAPATPCRSPATGIKCVRTTVLPGPVPLDARAAARAASRIILSSERGRELSEEARPKSGPTTSQHGRADV